MPAAKTLAELKAARATAKKDLDDKRSALESKGTEDKDAVKSVVDAEKAYHIATEEYTDALEKAESLGIDIESRLAAVRKEEKDKLYPDLEKAKNEAKAKEEELARIKAELEEERKSKKAKTKEGDDTKPVGLTQEHLDEALAKATAAQEKKFKEELAARDAQIAEQQKTLAQRDLADYKRKRVAEVGDNLIEAMVGGTTKEEIDDSIIRAQQEYQRVVSKIGAASQEAGDQQRGAVPTPPPSGSQTPPAGNAPTPEQIKAMSPQDYAKFRESPEGQALLKGLSPG